MYDMSVPNAKPGPCAKCKGTGLYQWGACVNGKMQFSAMCFSCQGTGQQSKSQIKRNVAYNHFKLKRIMDE